jgi:hypothetical protein
MTARFFWIAFATGLAAIAWVGVGFVGTHALALAMTVAIAAAYLLGAYELRQYRADTAALGQALAEVPAQVPAAGAAPLGDWLAQVPAGLRTAVRLRIEAGSGALPGPALTPYLVGLLVMLGMLGTFLGMVVTFRGAVFALEGSTDLQAIRAALAEPIRGLGLSFGTSVAGVAASAMLGLMSALCRRERLAVARVLDASVATVLRPYSPAHQREEALRAAQAQAVALPQLVDRLDALMANIEQRSQQLDERLLAAQARFQQDAAASYTTLARDVGTALQDSLAAGARAAGESIRPVMEATMAQIAQDQARQEAQRLQAWSQQLQGLADGLTTQGQQAAGRMDTLAQQMAGRTGELLQATADRMEALAQQTTASVAAMAQQVTAGLEALGHNNTTNHQALASAWQAQMEALRADEQRRGDAAVARLGELQAGVAQHLATLGAALEAPLARLLQTASEVPQAAAGVLAQLRQEMAQLSAQENATLAERTALVQRLAALMQTVEEAARQATQMAALAQANAVELSSWGDAFGQGVELFHAGNEKLATALQQVEAAISRSTARSDEQLAYYVAQAREVIDLSISAQHGVIEKLRTLGSVRSEPAEAA